MQNLGVPNIEVVRLAHRGRLRNIWHGVYRVVPCIPIKYNRDAEAVTIVREEAILYGESVLDMLSLILINSPVIYVTIGPRIRKNFQHTYK